MILRLSLSLGVLTLAGLTSCSSYQPPPPDPNQAAQTACGERADTVVEKQNRGYFMTPNTQQGTPYSSNGLVYNPIPALVREKERDDLANQCLHGSATNTGSVPITQ
jgi:hypothetical protein